jgi:hypothetical protein
MDEINQQPGMEEELESVQPLEFGSNDFAVTPANLPPDLQALTGSIEALSSNLVWKMGKEEGTENVIVRMGYATSTASFKELPKLRGASDAEIADAAKRGELTVEWID